MFIKTIRVEFKPTFLILMDESLLSNVKAVKMQMMKHLRHFYINWVKVFFTKNFYNFFLFFTIFIA